MKYQVLVESFKRLEETTKRLEKTHIIAELLRETEDDRLKEVLLMLRGKVFPDYDDRDLGISNKLAIKAISVATGYTESDIKDSWREIGDLGEVTQEYIENKKQGTLFQKPLTVKKVYETLESLPTYEGNGSTDQKIKRISKLLGLASPIEAKYVIRTVLQDLRVGVAEGTIRDGIAWAYLEEVRPRYDEEDKSIDPDDRDVYQESIDLIQDKINITNDFYQVAKAAKKGKEELEKITIQVGKPLKSMLAKRSKTIEEAFETTGKPSALEYKYDGIRMQIHYWDDNVEIFTRRLERVTEQFPEVEEYVKNNVNCDSAILDCEAVGYDSKTKEYTTFQKISKRIKRKYDIDRLAEELPVELNVFDILYLNDETLLKKPYKERRKNLEDIINPEPFNIIPSKQINTGDVKEAQAFFEKANDEGNEGLMFKNLDAIYKPGNRVGYMVKYKSTLDDLDLVITGAEWGTGKRKGWLTSLLVSCYNQETGMYEEVGKVGTGLKEKEEEGMTFNKITEMLKPLIKEEKGREVKIKPEVVIQVRFEEIQKSPEYGSNYALRFPRFITVREDRKPEGATTKEEIKEMYDTQ